jgi:CYTH domain-containing protein
MEAAQTSNTSTVELELTFLARDLPIEIKGAQGKQLVDIYIPETEGIHPRLRLRQKGDHYEITKKIPAAPGDASAHHEITIPLSKEEFEALAPSSSKRVVKTRYNVEIDGHRAEVDAFQENLAGLVVIDFEFDDEKAKLQFVAPSICLADVTQEDFIAGGLLAGKRYSDIEPELKRFNYTRINA